MKILNNKLVNNNFRPEKTTPPIKTILSTMVIKEQKQRTCFMDKNSLVQTNFISFSLVYLQLEFFQIFEMD